MIEATLTSMSVVELRSLTRSLAEQRTVLRFRELQVYAELAERGFDSMGLRGLPDLVQADLRCSRSAARALAAEVERFVGRNNVSGEPSDPSYPVIAEQLSTGRLGFEHAKIIADVIDALPIQAQLEHGRHVESLLVEQTVALELQPESLKRLAERVVGHLDPDGPEPPEECQHRQRRVELAVNPDGTGFLQGRLSATATAIWQAVLEPLAARRRADELGPDSRTRWQRAHDAFEEAGRSLLEGGRLPDHAGLPAQLLITMDLRDLESGVGQATTHHGGTLSVQQALRLAAEASVIPVILDQELGLVAHGRGRRLASPIQRKVLFARDRGCSFPGCVKTAAESEIHHLQDWSRGGATDLNNLTITCGYHNNEAPKQGWSTQSIGGVPHWRPPAWRDPEQRPRRNWLHHPELLRRELRSAGGGGRADGASPWEHRAAHRRFTAVPATIRAGRPDHKPDHNKVRR